MSFIHRKAVKMKNFGISSLLYIGAFLAITTFVSCDSDDDDTTTPVITQVTLNDQEIQDLKFLREEEKLARDVYLHLYESYGLNIFNNISSSEQKHMDAVLAVMNQYDIADAATSERGVFNNSDLQQLYNDLITQGELSLIEALKVGATIEDVDIRDLKNAINATSNQDLIGMYEKLECGSRNHMRGFISQLESNGGSYTPQFITQEAFDLVLNGAHENCGN